MERGSTEEHLTVTQFKVAQEQQRLEDVTAQIAQTEQALDTAQAAVEKKQKELQSLQKQTKEQHTAALTVQEIRSMGKKTLTGNITLTPSECSTLKDYAVNGILAKAENSRLEDRLQQAQKSAAVWKQRYESLKEQARPYLEAVKLSPDKNKKKVRKPKEEWIRVENTHEAIISRDVFEQVQKQIASRRRQQKDATTQIFAGLVKCADCGWSMRFGTNRQNKTPYSYFTCSQYGQMGTQCSAHYIRYDTLYVYVLSRIQYWSHRAQLSEEKLLQQILKNGDRERMTAAKRQESELKRAEKRKAEVDGKLVRMYENWSAGRITEYNFNLLTKKYQAEQLELEEKISRLQAELSAEHQTALDAEKWVTLIKQYANPTELTAELLNALIEKIVIHEATKGEDGMREQEIEIYYRFIGKID